MSCYSRSVTKGEREAFAAIQAAADEDAFRITAPHATDVMEVWNMHRADLRFGLLDAESCTLQKNGRYSVPTEIEGRVWVFILEIEPEFVVVTLFTPEQDR